MNKKHFDILFRFSLLLTYVVPIFSFASGDPRLLETLLGRPPRSFLCDQHLVSLAPGVSSPDSLGQPGLTYTHRDLRSILATQTRDLIGRGDRRVAALGDLIPRIVDLQNELFHHSRSDEATKRLRQILRRLRLPKYSSGLANHGFAAVDHIMNRSMTPEEQQISLAANRRFWGASVAQALQSAGAHPLIITLSELYSYASHRGGELDSRLKDFFKTTPKDSDGKPYVLIIEAGLGGPHDPFRPELLNHILTLEDYLPSGLATELTQNALAMGRLRAGAHHESIRSLSDDRAASAFSERNQPSGTGFSDSALSDYIQHYGSLSGALRALTKIQRASSITESMGLRQETTTESTHLTSQELKYLFITELLYNIGNRNWITPEKPGVSTFFLGSEAFLAALYRLSSHVADPINQIRGVRDGGFFDVATLNPGGSFTFPLTINANQETGGNFTGSPAFSDSSQNANHPPTYYLTPPRGQHSDYSHIANGPAVRRGLRQLFGPEALSIMSHDEPQP